MWLHKDCLEVYGTGTCGKQIQSDDFYIFGKKLQGQSDAI